MSADNYTYDATGSAPENLVTEVHTVVSRGIFPDVETFYRKDFKVEGYRDSNWVVLKENVDYVFSPLFQRIAAATGIEAFAYIVLAGDLSTYTRVRLTLQAVGKYRDTALMAAINELDFDRFNFTEWLKVRSVVESSIPTRHPDLENKDILEVLNSMLTQINGSLEKLSVAGIGEETLRSRVQKLEQQVLQLQSI